VTLTAADAAPLASPQENPTMHNLLLPLSAVAVCILPTAVQGQWPGPAKPWQGGPGMPAANGRFGPVVGPGIPGLPQAREQWPPLGGGLNQGVPQFLQPALPAFPPQEKRRDEDTPWAGITHLIPHHLPEFPGGANAESFKDLHMPKAVPQAGPWSASEFKFTPTRFAPVSHEATTIARGLSGLKGPGILAGIGGALAALFGGLFGRKHGSDAGLQASAPGQPQRPSLKLGADGKDGVVYCNER
jgi:hypothetical protein